LRWFIPRFITPSVSLLHQNKALQEREKALSDVLRNLKEGYNPNYQDMAILEAVCGWEGLSDEQTRQVGSSVTGLSTVHSITIF